MKYFKPIHENSAHKEERVVVMKLNESKTIAVTGASGLQGSSVTRHLLREGWQVRALTRNPESDKAKRLATLGAEILRVDMDDPASLDPAFEGAYGVFSVQNPMTSGMEGEIRQGKNVADAAKRQNIQHLVYASAGIGIRGTNIPSWESKLIIEDHIKSLGLPVTIFRPMAFMELMTEQKFFPAVSTWHIMPKLMGSSQKVFWLSTEDLGIIAAKAFANPDEYIGKDLKLASDVKSIDDCQAIYREVMGKNPPRFPMPVWMFDRFGFVGKDLGTMWRWLHTANLNADTKSTCAIHPGALTVRDWLEKYNTGEIKVYSS